jgi:RNA polymerase sigma-70 factor (ECF subfamily)
MDRRTEEDRGLVERMRAGDEGAFGILLNRYQRPVINFLYRMLGSAEDAHDAAQEVFVRVYRGANRFAYRTARDRFSTWLFQVARNVAIDHLRRRRPEEPLDSASPADLARAVAPGTPATDAAAHEIGDRIAAAVAELPEDQRTALVLAEYHDLPNGEIANVMRCSVKSVESRLYRAKRFLRKQLRHLLES